MKKLLLMLFPVFLFMNQGLPKLDKGREIIEEQTNMFTTSFPSTDGLPVTADIYLTEDPDAPWIILFHQAGYSRGEYRPIAPRLNKMGFNCMAVDQRSGKAINDVVNKTHNEAVQWNLKTKYPDAFPDLEASLLYVKNNFKPTKTIIWGSSYSAALVFILASKHKSDVAALAAFSPGEYFSFEGKKIADFAKEVDCPVFITSASSEHKSWKGIYDELASKNKTGFLPESKGLHGSKALWENKKGNEEYWKALTVFLEDQL